MDIKPIQNLSASNNKIAIFSSGGKDGVMAYWKAIEAGYTVDSYVNLFLGNKISYHFLNKRLTKMQGNALGIKVVQKEIPDQRKNKELFEKSLLHIIKEIKLQGIHTIGGAYISETDYQHKILKRMCNKLRLKLFNPYLGRTSKDILEEIITLKIRAIITAIDMRKLEKKWLGRTVNKHFLSHIIKNIDIDPLGDKGEYHTFVIDAPFFLKKINILKSEEKEALPKDYYLKIDAYSLIPKKL